MHHSKGSEEFLDIVHTGMDGLNRLSNRRIKSSNLHLKIGEVTKSMKEGERIAKRVRRSEIARISKPCR